MDKQAILELLKIDLHLSSNAYDILLNHLIDMAIQAMVNEGITVDLGKISDAMLVMKYASYLFDKRHENVGMPRDLRWQLNNRLFREKAGGQNA